MTKNPSERSVQDLMNLQDKKAVVTGGGGHLGLRMSEALLELGAEVYVVGQTIEKITSLATAFPGKVTFLDIDLSNKDCVAALRTLLPETLDICVNNAYVWPKNTNFEKIDWDEVTSTFVSGAVSPLFVARIAFEKMQAGGSIINIASMYGSVSPDFRIYRESGMSSAVEYGATKAALIQMTRYLAIKGAPHNIRVNAVSPGPFSKPGSFDGGKEGFKEELLHKVPLGRIGENWELKGAVAFLASDLSTYITGQNIAVDGGWTVW